VRYELYATLNGAKETNSSLAGHKEWIECVAFSHDSKILISGG
jgi:WD40 repeat protein